MPGFSSFAVSPKTKELVSDSRAPSGSGYRQAGQMENHHLSGLFVLHPPDRRAWTQQSSWKPVGKAAFPQGAQEVTHINSPNGAWEKCLPTFRSLERGEKLAPETPVKGEMFLSVWKGTCSAAGLEYTLSWLAPVEEEFVSTGCH